MFRNDTVALTQKTKALFDGQKGALIQFRRIRGLDKRTMPPLNSFHFPEDMTRYLDLRAELEIEYWEQRKDVADDLFPSIAPWYGIAEHTAFLGGEVEFSTSTSYNHVILPDWNDLDKLKLDESNPWLRMVVDGVAYYKKNYSDCFLPKLRGADGPSDISNIVRGNDLFYDVYDEPELVMKLNDFSADAARFTLELQKKAAGMYEGGYLTGFDIWMPGDCIGQISEDASCMLSPEIYRDIFLPGLRRCAKGYDNVMLHTHSLGKRIIPCFASVEDITAIEISNDPNCDRAMSVWREYRSELHDKVVILNVNTLDELEANRDLLEDSRCIVWYYAENLEDARRTLAWMRRYDVK